MNLNKACRYRRTTLWTTVIFIGIVFIPPVPAGKSNIASSGTAGGGWQTAFEEKFAAPDWTQRWTLIGSVGPLAPGALRGGGTELTASIKQEFKAPAVRVEFEAQMASTDAEGHIGDLSCMIGWSGGKEPTCALQFGAQNNTETRITFPNMPVVTTNQPLIATGKWYQVSAEVNGRVAGLNIDGQRILTALLPGDLPQYYVSLYTWCGNAQFRNVRVSTKGTADPPPAGLKPPEKKQLVDPPQELKPWREWSVPPVAEVKPAAVARQKAALTVDNPSAYSGPWPITMGFPIPKDTLWDINAIRITDKAGKEIPSEARLAATWSKGGSIQWVHLDFQPMVSPRQAAEYFVEFGRDVKHTPVAKPVQVAEDARMITVDNGTLKLVISRERGSLIESAWLDPKGKGNYKEQIIRPEGGHGSYFVTAEGERYTTIQPDKQYTAVVESADPMRVVIRTRGWYQNARGERAGYYVNRLYIYQGSPQVRLVTTWVNTVDTDKFKFQDLATHFPITLKGEPRATLGTDAAFTNTSNAVSGPPPMLAVQAGRHEGFIRQGNQKSGLRDAGGWVDLSDGKQGLTVAVFDMEKQWPNAIEARANEIVFHGFSNEGGHNLDFSFEFLKKYWGEERYTEFERNRGHNSRFTDRIFNACGLAKTHEIILQFHGKETEPAITQFAEAAQKMIIAHADPAWVCASGAIGPVHPFDPQRFPKFEESLPKQFDKYLDVLDHLTPVYGFYDYGMGIGQYQVTARKNSKGDTEYIYRGYRREYDIGYANPIVPWLMFLRSGDNRYYRYAIAFSRHCSDAHTHHWTNPRLKKQTGWIIDGSGSWVYDSEDASFTFNNWLEHQVLDYYVTGDERLMDVAFEVIDAVHQECVTEGKPFGYCGSAGIWHGNASLMYRAAWEDKLADLWRLTERQQLAAWCPECGGFAEYPGTKHKEGVLGRGGHGMAHRQLWREYGLYHGSLVPDHSTNLDIAFTALGQMDLHALGWEPRPGYYGSSHAHIAAYQKTKDKRFIKFAQMQTGHEAPTLAGWSGLCTLRNIFAWMTLAILPGAENVQIPLKITCKRAEANPIFLQHVQARETTLTTTRLLRVTDPKGNNVTDKTIKQDKAFNEVILQIPPDQPSGIYRVEAADLSTNLWRPFTPITFIYPPDLKFMLGMADGIDAGGKDKIWLYIPAGTREAKVCVPGPRKTTLTMPDNTVFTGTGSVWSVTFPPSDKAQLVSLTQDEAHRYGFFKIFGVPAYAALTKEAAFEMTGDLKTIADPPPSDLGAEFVAGALPNSAGNQALQFNGVDYLEIPLGEKAAEGRRAHFDANQGTMEFFIKLNTSSDLLDANGLPIRVELDKSLPTSANGWTRGFLFWDYKTGIIFSDSVRSDIAGMLSPVWGDSPPTTLRAGRWYHLAVIWKLNDNGRMLRESYLNGQPYQRLDPFSLDRSFWPVPYEKPLLTAPIMEIGCKQGRGHFDLVLDELRVSDNLRYEFNKEFVPPAAPFQPDKNTLLLFHFDGDTTGLSGAGGAQVTAVFTNKPGLVMSGK